MASSSASQPISRVRKVAAALAMTGAGAIVAKEAFSAWHTEWLLVAFAGVLAAAGIGITRKSLVAQVLSRGAAWIVLLPALLIIGFGLLNKSLPDLSVAGLGVGTALGLLLGRPMLHTEEARAAFAPKAFRKVFLAGSTASIATAMLTGAIAIEAFPHRLLTGAGFGALTISLLASAIGVVKMRGWGIVLGTATSLLLLVTSLISLIGSSSMEAFAFALLSAPALLLHLLPILLARFRSSSPSTTTTTSTRVHVEPEATQYRVASYTGADLDLDLDTHEAPRAAAAALRA